jgi:hypothetical protein
MSYKNRKKEYERLISLGREKDISQALQDEFGAKPPTIEPVKKKVKK